MKNILESFLDALEVRYTKRYVRRLYEEHPHRGNMYGLKQMLAVYGVRALGVYGGQGFAESQLSLYFPYGK